MMSAVNGHGGMHIIIMTVLFCISKSSGNEK
jgi:hypothetical protein